MGTMVNTIRSLSAIMTPIPISVFVFATQIATAAIQIRLTISVLATTDLYPLAVTTSVLDIFALPVLIAAVTFHLRPIHHRIVLPFHLISASAMIVANILTVYCLGWLKSHMPSHPNLKDAQSLVNAGIVLWIFAFIGLVVFYTVLLWPQPPQPELFFTEYGPQRASPARSAKRAFEPRLAPLSPPPPFFKITDSTHSSSLSLKTPSSGSSFRDSVAHALRPMTSKTRLMIRGSYASGESPSLHSTRPISVDNVREIDGFDRWDTSAVDNHTSAENLALMPATHDRVDTIRLETIPGSRPVSPAKPLEGPFLDTFYEAENTPLPESPPSALDTAPQQPVSLDHSPVLRSNGSFSSLQSLRSPRSIQSHIHPLFRSESPNPPPLTSPGTVITASPLAGQVVSQDLALGPRKLHSAQGHRANGRDSPLAPPSRPSSAKSFRLQPSLLIDEMPSAPWLGHVAG